MHETTINQPTRPEVAGGFGSAALAVAGAAAIGWIVAVPDNVFASIKMALVTPAILVGLTATLSPALYILLALTGASTEPQKFVAAIGAGLRTCGLTAVALAGPLLFLAATSTDPKTPIVAGTAGLGLALIAGLGTVDRRAQSRHTSASAVAMIGWSVAALAIGLRLFAGALS